MTTSVRRLNVVENNPDAPLPSGRDLARVNEPLSGSQDQAKSGSSAEKSGIDASHFRPYLLGKVPIIQSSDDFSDLYAEISYQGLTALYPLKSARLHDHLNILADEYTRGDPEAIITEAEFRDIQAFFRAKAHRVAVRRPVFKRVAWLPEDRAIWIDLSWDDGQCVRIDAAGWEVEEPLHPLFVRTPTQRPLPRPEHCDDGEAAFARLAPPGISPEHRKLLIGAVLACLVSPSFAKAFSFPIIVLTGEAASGKSTLAKLIKALVDPEVTETAVKPTKIDDLFVAAQTSHLLSYDNVDFVKGSLSDAFCQLTTGSAVAKRKLYTDGDMAILKAMCPVLLNGIHPDLPRSDLLDRSITIHLSRIRNFQSEAVERTDAELPLVFGYLCTLLSRALRNFDAVTLTNPPRLEMVARLATAAEPFGVATPYVDLLRANQKEALIASYDNDLVTSALFDLVAEKPVWSGTYKQLLSTLTSKADHASAHTPEWPASPHKLARHMRQHARLLREQGLEFATGAKTEHGRLVTVRRVTTSAFEAPF